MKVWWFGFIFLNFFLKTIDLELTLIKRGSIHGGHFGPNLGMVEMTIALHYLLGKKENIIAVIGDGSLSGGEAFEGLDFVPELNSN